MEFVRSHKAQSVQSEETNKKEDALEKAGGPPSSGPVFYCERSMEEGEPQPPSAIITGISTTQNLVYCWKQFRKTFKLSYFFILNYTLL